MLFSTSVDGMDLLPSNIDLSGAEVQLVHEVGREYVLGGALKPVVPDYDYILIDCQPSLGLLTINALACADSVLIPLECEYFAMRGVALLMETIDKVQQRLNPRLTIDGLLGTMYDSRTLHTREVLGSIVNGFGDKVFHTVINRTVRFPDATVAGEPITSFDSGSMGAVPTVNLPRRYLSGGGRQGTVTPGKYSGDCGDCCAPPHLIQPRLMNARRPAGKSTIRRLPSTCPPPSCSTLSMRGWHCAGLASLSTGAGSSARPSPSCSPTSTRAGKTACWPGASRRAPCRTSRHPSDDRG